jgi:formate dehydrogenase
MLESIEGKRGLPRHKPPFVFQRGLFGRPTLVNNVETLFWVPEILRRGAEWWRGLGLAGQTGQRFYSVSGRVRAPRIVLAGNGSSAAALITAAGGMAEGHALRAFLPGGASGGILPAGMADVPIGFGTLEAHGCFVGSAGLVVLSQADDLREVARELMRFFRDESCGQCSPCRVGTAKAVGLMQAPVWDTGLLTELSAAMRDASICGLGQAAPNPGLTLMRHFPEMFS